MKCPCEECISLAICYQKDTLQCEDLYKYLCMVDGDVPPISAFRGYHSMRGVPVYQLYKRWVRITSMGMKQIKLTNNRKLRIRCLHNEGW